jgi:hypothetical protein
MSRAFADLPGITVWDWPAGAPVAVRVEVGPAAGAEGSGGRDAAVEAEWARMRRDNPRLFDGPVLSVVRMDVGSGIVCRRDTYRRLVVQPVVPTGVEQLSVTGVIVGPDGSGQEAVLLGRRGRGTRMYGGMWELAPSGGLDPPAPGRAELSMDDLRAQLLRELREEVGGPLACSLADARVAAVLHDAAARSYDLVLRCRAGRAADAHGPAERWEYDSVRWLSLAGVAGFDRGHAAEIIPPTRALFRVLGWA